MGQEGPKATIKSICCTIVGVIYCTENWCWTILYWFDQFLKN